MVRKTNDLLQGSFGAPLPGWAANSCLPDDVPAQTLEDAMRLAGLQGQQQVLRLQHRALDGQWCRDLAVDASKRIEPVENGRGNALFISKVRPPGQLEPSAVPYEPHLCACIRRGQAQAYIAQQILDHGSGLVKLASSKHLLCCCTLELLVIATARMVGGLQIRRRCLRAPTAIGERVTKLLQQRWAAFRIAWQ